MDPLLLQTGVLKTAATLNDTRKPFLNTGVNNANHYY